MLIATIPAMNSPAVADVIQPMKPQLKQNLQDMSKLMVSISNELNTGKMSMEAQEAAASVTKQVSEILQKLSEGDRKYDAHKEGIDQMKGDNDDGGKKNNNPRIEPVRQIFGFDKQTPVQGISQTEKDPKCQDIGHKNIGAV